VCFWVWRDVQERLYEYTPCCRRVDCMRELGKGEGCGWAGGEYEGKPSVSAR
jgi:hypothetical protein